MQFASRLLGSSHHRTSVNHCPSLVCPVPAQIFQTYFKIYGNWKMTGIVTSAVGPALSQPSGYLQKLRVRATWMIQSRTTSFFKTFSILSPSTNEKLCNNCWCFIEALVASKWGCLGSIQQPSRHLADDAMAYTRTLRSDRSVVKRWQRSSGRI